MKRRLNNWIIVELSKFVCIGTDENMDFVVTDGILAFLNPYLVTEKNIYTLGKPDRVWATTAEGIERLEMYGYIGLLERHAQ